MKNEHVYRQGVAAILFLGLISCGAADQSRPTSMTETVETLINFDDAPQPGVFQKTVALRDFYAHLGVHFTSPVEKNGGAILNQVSNYDVDGFSAPNFLAFNRLAGLKDDGVPESPTFLEFDEPKKSVQLTVGSPQYGGATLSCYDDMGSEVGSANTKLEMKMKMLSVTAGSIAKCKIEVIFAREFIVDDFRFR